MQTDETSNQNSDRTKLAMETMKRYCDAHPENPSALRRPQLLVRGGLWIALLGPSVSEGIAGFGYTVDAALRAFDAQYLRGSDEPVAGQTSTVPDAAPASELDRTGQHVDLQLRRRMESHV